MKLSLKRFWSAIGVGGLGCLFIWIATPYNNFLLANSFISDSYFPVSSVLFILFVILVLNPVLRLIGEQWMLTRSQVALVFAMLLMAAVVPGQGLLRQLPWTLAQATQRINEWPSVSEAFEGTGIPHALFPDSIGLEVETPVSDQFLYELYEDDAPIPWMSWLRLVPVWGFFLLACWLLMIGVGLVLFPAWKEQERLPFPLLRVYRTLLPEEDDRRAVPTIFRDRVFWMGASLVMVIYLLNGLQHHTHGSFPGFPLGWRLSAHFSEEPWRYLPGYIANVPKLFFILVGMAFFMPNRAGFSIWITTIAYGLYVMIGRAYLPPFDGSVVTDHRNGAMIAVTVMVLYLSRHHWPKVAKSMFRRVATDEERLLRVSGWMLAAGALGMHAWLRWTGVPHVWAAVFVMIGFMVSVLIARVIAETGMPFMRITDVIPTYFMAMVPASWLTGAAIYISGFVAMIFKVGSRVSAAVMVTHAAGVDEESTPRDWVKIGYLMIIILVIGFIVGGAIQLHMGYNHGVTLDGENAMLNSWGASQMNHPQSLLVRWTRGSWTNPAARLRNLSGGIMIAGGLYIACMYMPKWPLHPIGMILVGNFFGNNAWASILLGWLIKVMLLKYGGAKTFRRADPFFMGLIMGEVFSAVIWTAVPVILIFLGVDPSRVGHIPILPT